jgi:hypothetical protein
VGGPYDPYDPSDPSGPGDFPGGCPGDDCAILVCMAFFSSCCGASLLEKI